MQPEERVDGESHGERDTDQDSERQIVAGERAVQSTGNRQHVEMQHLAHALAHQPLRRGGRDAGGAFDVDELDREAQPGDAVGQHAVQAAQGV